MNFSFDIVAFEALMLMYIAYSAILWGISALLDFLK
jgi:hypothetical protein